MKFKMFIYMMLLATFVYAQQNVEASRRDTIQYGTETEIASFIQTLRTENVDYLDDELIALIDNTRNQRILTGVFGFFGDREKGGLETRAVRAIVERMDETNETVIAAIDYLGRIKYAQAVPVLMELLDTEERRFLNNAFRAIGPASSTDRTMADETADFLVDYYSNRNPGDDNRSVVITAIGATGSSNGVPLLIEIASNTNERYPLRIAAVGALSAIGDAAGLDAILVCVNTDDPNVRSAAVAALGPFSGEEVDKAILDAFRDSYYRSRIAAAQASGVRKLASAVPYLRYRAENDDVPNVRDEAIRALGSIANEEAVGVLENLFTERRNSERVRILSAEMLMKVAADKNFSILIGELDEARARNQNNLYNGLLKIVGETVLSGDKSVMETIVSRFLYSGTVIEKLYALDMVANNNLMVFSQQIRDLANDRTETIARRARLTAQRLGIDLDSE